MPRLRGPTVQSRIRILGHPLHPVLVMFPLALFVTATAFDLTRFISGDEMFGEVGFWTASAGIVGAVPAAATGFADWTRIPVNTRARRVGRWHGALNGFALVLFVCGWLVRVANHRHVAGPASFALQVVAVGIAGVAAWLGGELVDRLGIGVADDANPDTATSLPGRGGNRRA